MRVLIVGCGRAGSGLARTMLLRGHQVTVVDKDPEAFKRLGPNFKGRQVVGIGFDRDVLLEAGIQRADGFAAVTASDEANVVAARIARQVFRVPKVVARLYDPGQAEIYRRLGLQTIAPVSWGIERIADLLLQSDLDVEYHIGAGEVNLVVHSAPPLLVGRNVNSITVPGEVHVVAVTRSGKTFLPSLGTVFLEGDVLHLAVLASSTSRLDELLAQR